MACKDKLVYFDAKARAEGIRQLFAVSGTEFCDDRINFKEFKKRRPGRL